MKVFAAAALLLATASANPFAPKVTKSNAKSKYVGRLMSKATPTRRLEQEEQEVDLSSYSIKFEKCQFVKQYDAEEGGNEEMDTVLTTKRFVVFRLCPEGSCSSCNYNYGEYIVDMETYLEAALEFKQEEQEQYCQACEECAAQDDAAAADADADAGRKLVDVDCSTCYDECQNIENMEENGYVDASEYTQCERIYENQNDDGTETVYYAGAMCASSGTRIKIGLFTDEDCSNYDADADLETYMVNDDGYSMKLSYHLLKQTFAEGECIANCLKEDENADEADDQEEREAEINEICEELYEAAGKCETQNGFENGIVNYDNYDNQVAQEELVCDFISSLSAGTYDQTGEIVISGGRSMLSGGTATTGGQKFALTFFILGSVGLAGYAAMLHNQLTKGAKADLSRQGGAMA